MLGLARTMDQEDISTFDGISLIVKFTCCSAPFQPDTFADFEEMTDRLVQEILHHIDVYGMKPSRIRLVAFHSIPNTVYYLFHQEIHTTITLSCV